MEEILSTISMISFIAAGVLLVVTVGFFFILKIPVVIGDLSKRNAGNVTARKQKNKKKDKKKTDGKSYSPSNVNVTDRLIEPIADLETDVLDAGQEKKSWIMETDILSDSIDSRETEILSNSIDSRETDILSDSIDSRETDILSDNADSKETAVMYDEYETMVLDETESLDEAAELEQTGLLGAPQRTGGVPMTVLDNIILIHTDEEVIV